MTQTKNKKPDDTGHKRHESRWEVGVSAGPDVFQLGAVRFEDGQMVEAWVAPIHGGSAAEKRLIEFVKTYGVNTTDAVSTSQGAAERVEQMWDRKSLELGDKVPCEVCGKAVRGAADPGCPPMYHPHVHDQVLTDITTVPDAAGRVFGDEEGRIAVCIDNDACWDVFWTHWIELHRRAAESLGMEPK